jgi:hypothetical protein
LTLDQSWELRERSDLVVRPRLVFAALGAVAVVPDCRLEPGVERTRDVARKAVTDVPCLARRHTELSQRVFEDASVRLACADIGRRYDGVEASVEAEVGQTGPLDVATTVGDDREPVERAKHLQYGGGAIK